MKILNESSINQVYGGSVLGVVTYSTIGFWVGGVTGLFMTGALLAIPGAMIGMTVGAYLGTDGPAPQVTYIYINEKGEVVAPS